MLLPYPPSANRYYRSFRGRMVRSSAAVAYRETVERIANENGVRLHEGPVKVTIRLLPPKPQDWLKRLKRVGVSDSLLGVRRIDLDNALKVALDALQGIAYLNDRQITTLRVSLGMAVECGGVLATVDEDKEWLAEMDRALPVE